MRREDLSLTIIVNTHGHADHIVGNGQLMNATKRAVGYRAGGRVDAD